MIESYLSLHRAGHAHSIEVWHGKRPVGGLYGIQLGQMFFGESMFGLASDASKTALVLLNEIATTQPLRLIDCQVYTGHPASLGARELSRERFQDEMTSAVSAPRPHWRHVHDATPPTWAGAMMKHRFKYPLYPSAPHPATICRGRPAAPCSSTPTPPWTWATYSELLRYGFRRSGKLVYAPRCETCSQCVSVRVPVDEFVAARTHRRVRALNTDVEVREHPPGSTRVITPFTSAIPGHDTGTAAWQTPRRQTISDSLLAPWCNTKLLEFFVGDRWLQSQSLIFRVTECRLSHLLRARHERALTRHLLRSPNRSNVPALRDSPTFLSRLLDSRQSQDDLQVQVPPDRQWRDGRWRRFGPDDRLHD